MLLGQDNGKSINVANSFGVPFEEDDKDAKTWFLDHNYVEAMFEMFKKVNGVCPALRNPVRPKSLTGPLSTRQRSAGTHDRVVPHGPETTSVRLGDQ